MTREEWMEDIVDIDDLMRFCYNEGCEILDDTVYSEDAMNDYINTDLLYEWANNCTWQELKRILNDLPIGEDWVMINVYGDWSSVGDYDFDDFLERVADWCEENGYFDDDDEEDEDETDSESEEEVPVEVFETDLFLAELMFDSEQEWSKAEQKILAAEIEREQLQAAEKMQRDIERARREAEEEQQRSQNAAELAMLLAC